MHGALSLAFFGSSLVSAFWNGAATYYRGILKALADRGHRITFYEPDAFDRQRHRDMADPPWARIVVYDPTDREEIYRLLHSACEADIVIKASGVGVNDQLLEAEVLNCRRANNVVVFWDVDAPATLERVKADVLDPFRLLIADYDLILTYGGGKPVIDEYLALGAKGCVPIYNALDSSTHYPVPPDPRHACDLLFVGNRLPDREGRVEEFFSSAARRFPTASFFMGGSGWADKQLPANVKLLGHVFTADHNVLNCSAKAVLNISRESMARYGYSPATRLFEAAGAGACIISDQWQGLDLFFDEGREILTATSGEEVAELLVGLTIEKARSIGACALRRVRAEHTYEQRADLFEEVFATGSFAGKEVQWSW